MKKRIALHKAGAVKELLIDLLLIVGFLAVVAGAAYLIITSLMKWSVPGLG